MCVSAQPGLNLPLLQQVWSPLVRQLMKRSRLEQTDRFCISCLLWWFLGLGLKLEIILRSAQIHYIQGKGVKLCHKRIQSHAAASQKSTVRCYLHTGAVHFTSIGGVNPLCSCFPDFICPRHTEGRAKSHPSSYPCKIAPKTRVIWSLCTHFSFYPNMPDKIWQTATSFMKYSLTKWCKNSFETGEFTCKKKKKKKSSSTLS